MNTLRRSAAVLALTCTFAAAYAGAGHRSPAPAEPEALPHTEQLESGQLTLQQLSDRQLTAFLVDLTQRVNYDRQQHNGVAGPDSQYLLDWTARIADEMKSRGLAADDNGNIQPPPRVER